MEDLSTFQDIYRDVSDIPVHTMPYNPSNNPTDSLFRFYETLQPTDPSRFPSLSDVTGIFTETLSKVASVPSQVVGKVTSTVRNTYLYLIGGIVVVGILAIFVLGAGTKFAGTIQR